MDKIEFSLASAVASFPHDFDEINGVTKHRFACRRCQLAMRVSLFKNETKKQLQQTIRELEELTGSIEEVAVAYKPESE